MSVSAYCMHIVLIESIESISSSITYWYKYVSLLLMRTISLSIIIIENSELFCSSIFIFPYIVLDIGCLHFAGAVSWHYDVGVVTLKFMQLVRLGLYG